jgi:translation initiation factor eIF-2B subunit delta
VPDFHIMAAESNGVPSGAPSAAPAAQDGAKNAPAPANPTATPATPATTEKLTPAQLKAKAKAEKAARRAQVKDARAAAPPVLPAQEKGAAADGKGGKGKGKDGYLSAHRPSVSGRRPSSPIGEKDVRSGIPDCFSHVPMAKRIPLSQTHKDVHPAVLAVGQQMATFALNDSISRLKATLLAFRKVRFCVVASCAT